MHLMRCERWLPVFASTGTSTFRVYERLLAGRGFVMAGFFVLQSFAQYFVADKLQVANPAGTTALLMAIMGAAILLLAVPMGVPGERVGPPATQSLFRHPWRCGDNCPGFCRKLAAIGGDRWGFVGAAVQNVLTVNWAWAADMVPL